MTTQELATRIETLKAGRTMKQLKSEDIKLFYRVQKMASELSELKAKDNGQVITKEHLTEYKNLIIWILKNKVNYRGYLNLIEAMQSMVDDISAKKYVFKTQAGIKSIVCKIAISNGLNNVEKNLREMNGLDIYTSESHPIIANFVQHRLNVLMNN